MLGVLRRPVVRRLGFLAAISAILVVGSERMFWYWSPSLGSHPEAMLVYAVPAAGLVWAIDRFGVTTWWSLVLATPVFGYLVEGVLTPILYEGGPILPVYPAFFAAWHGLLSAAGLVFAVRWWLVTGAARRLLWFSAGVGSFWGAWAFTSTLPDRFDDPELIADLGGPLHVLGVGEFAIYAVTFTAVLAGAHWLLGRGLWVDEFRPGRVARWVYAAAVAAVVGAWTVSIPWAAPMFAAYVGLQVWALRRHRATATGPGLLARLRGPVAARSLFPLMAMPVAATLVYGGLWVLGPTDEVVFGVLFAPMFAVFAIGGLVITAGAIRRVVRTSGEVVAAAR